MTQNGTNQYGNPAYSVPRQQQQYLGGTQGMQNMPGQQPVYTQQPLPTQQPTQQTQYVGGPMEASGSTLIPVGPVPGSFFGGTQGSANSLNNLPGMLPLNQSFIENILRLNKGKLATFYMTYENNMEWNAKVFKGIIEAAGRDHIIISDPQTGMRILLLMVNLDYVTFDEEIEYDYPFRGGMMPTAPYQPR